MALLPQWFRKAVRKTGALVLGREPGIHRIPFGPLRGKRIFMRFDFSPRMFFGVNEPWIARLTQEYVAPGDVIYDIGAHIGYTSLLFAQRLAGSGAVHAFEILPSIAETFLKKTAEANDFANIVIHNIGLSATDQELELPVGDTGMTSIYSAQAKGQQLESCKTVTLDQYVLQQGLPFPSLMKIDIEGAEMDCLTGGKALLEKCLPRLIVEFHHLDLLQEGLSFLSPFGYRLYLHTGDMVDQRVLAGMKQFHESVLCLPGKS